MGSIAEYARALAHMPLTRWPVPRSRGEAVLQAATCILEMRAWDADSRAASGKYREYLEASAAGDSRAAAECHALFAAMSLQERDRRTRRAGAASHLSALESIWGLRREDLHGEE